MAVGEIAQFSANRSAFLARLIVAPESRGQGLGRALVDALLHEAFVRFKLHRVELNVFDFNRAAIACYEAAGFRREGHLRDVCWTGKEFWSQYRMAILAPQYEARPL